MNNLGIFWWVFALRGGFALLFSGVLYLSAALLGTIFFDPVLHIFFSLLLGFYILGNALLLGVTGGFAIEHHRHFGWLLLAECAFAIALAVYIGHSLLITAHTLALLAGLHAAGTGCFQAALAFKLRYDRHCVVHLGLCAIVSLCVGALFLTHHTEALRPVASWLSLYELLYGFVLIALARRLHQQRPSVPAIGNGIQAR